MRMSTSIILLFLSLSFNLKAQTSITGIVTDSLNNPIPFASVYLSKTTNGTLTDNKGNYVLSVLQDGVYEMITSCIGYKPNSQVITADGKKQIINIKLSVNLFLLNEITIKSKDRNRQKNYAQFVKLFIGETVNAESCKIINPEDLHLYKDPQNNVLKGYSIKPFRIENKALGYTILYDLTDFSFNYITGFLEFSGHEYFQPLKGNLRRNHIWEHNRLVAYYGSKMHLLRALYSDSLSRENYQIFECRFDSTDKNLTIIKTLQDTNISLSRRGDCLTIYNKNPLLISYTDNHSELTSALFGFQSHVYQSTILFSDTLKVYKNGFYNHPYSVTWGGEMANERLADMLPFDFLPRPKIIIEADPDKDLSPIEKYLVSQQNFHCRDQVFVHLDRNMYYPGDTIHFQAYIRDRFTSIFESKSTSFYALLFNDAMKMIDSSRFKIENSTSSGWMTIPVNAKPGKCHFVAFTGMMQNFDPVDAFQLDLIVNDKNNFPEKVEITFDKENYRPGDSLEAIIRTTDERGNSINKLKSQFSLTTGNRIIHKGETYTNLKGESIISLAIPDTLTNQPGLQIITKNNSSKLSVIKDIKIPFNDQYLELRFLPEGGTLVAGLEQRIGFNATNIKGESVYIEGLLKNSKGIILDTIKSGKYGPGLFVCTPQQGMHIELIKGAGKEKKWQLPDPVNQGLCLRVSPIDDRSFAVEIQSDNYTGDTVTISGTMNMTQIFSQEFKLNKKQRMVVETDQLPTGVTEITLFDKGLRPVAERLFYVNADKHLKYNIKTEKAIFGPGQETELTISVTDAAGTPVDGIFSIAVVDSLKGHNAELYFPGIEYTYNYHPYFAANLPPKVVAEGLENLEDDQRDLLLMVYGWSKINWDFRQNTANANELINYDQLKMKILYALKNRRADRRLDLVSLEGPSIMHLFTNKTGEISLPLDSLPKDTRSVTMMPDARNIKRVTGAMLSIPYNEQYFKSNKLFIPQPIVSTITYKTRTNTTITAPTNTTKSNQNLIPSSIDKIIEIPEVIITGHPGSEKVYHDKYEESYQYADVRSLDYERLWSSFSLEDAIRKVVAPYMITDTYIVLHAPHSFFGGPVPALFVLDGMPLYSQGWPNVKTISPGEVTSLTVLNGPQGQTMYGLEASGGVIFVNTQSNDQNLMKIRTDWKLQHKKDKMLLPISIYRPYIEFYNPTKSEISVDPMLQTRPTIFWDPEISFSSKEAVKIKYTNLNHHGPVLITINGVSFNNLVGTGRASYQVY